MVLGQGLVLDRGLEEDLLQSRKEELRRELNLASGIAAGSHGPEPDELVRILHSRLGLTVTLLERDGRVVAISPDLSSRFVGVSLPIDREEIRGALAGETGFSLREESGGSGMRLFAAVPFESGGVNRILQVATPLDEVRGAAGARTRGLLALGAVSFLFSLALVSFLGRAFSDPLRALADRARSLPGGSPSPAPPANGRANEVRELSQAFDGMAHALADRFRTVESERDEMQSLVDYLGEAVVSLTADARILRLNQAAADLLEIPRPLSVAPLRTLVDHPALRSLLESALVKPFHSREFTLGDRNFLVSSRGVERGGAVVTFLDVTEVRRVETVRRDFVANASHELKTPLTAIRGFAETLLEDDLPKELRTKWLGSIRSNTLRLQRLVEDLLDLSRLESGGWIARKEVVEVGPLVEGVFEDFRETAGDRGLTLAVSGDALALADEQGLEEVLKNLVENALRYSPMGGTVRVDIQELDGLVRMAVEDKGTGIPKSALPRVFERFFRVDPARSRREGGTGLGLAIVRHLVTAMGGEVWAESEPDQGTKVYFTLPVFKTEA